MLRKKEKEREGGGLPPPSNFKKKKTGARKEEQKNRTRGEKKKSGEKRKENWGGNKKAKKKGGGPADKGRSCRRFPRTKGEPDGANLLFMLEENGQPIGFMNTVVFYSVWAHGKVLFLDDFFIREPFREKAIGQLLLQSWRSLIQREGLLRVQLLAGEYEPEGGKVLSP